MIFNKCFYENLAIADKIIARAEERGFTRGRYFFPRLSSVMEKNPKYGATNWFEQPEIVKVPADIDLMGFVHLSPFCCGFAEISGSWLIGPSSMSNSFGDPYTYSNKAISPDFKDLGYTGLQFHTAFVAHIFRGISKIMLGRGIMFYNAPEDGRWKIQLDLLKSFGFTKLAEFANPSHGYRSVSTFAVHTMDAGEAVDKWPDGLSTRVAQIAVAGTM